MIVVPDAEKRLKPYIEKLEKMNHKGLKRAAEYLDFFTENKKFTNNEEL